MEMKGSVIQVYGNRVLAQDEQGHFFICKDRKAYAGKEITAKDYIIVPSFMFGMSLLMEENPGQAMDQMLANYKKGWTW